MHKLFACLISLVLSGALLFACAAAEESVYTQEMFDRAMTSTGNTLRLHAAIDKAARGEKVSIVYLGGSITEGSAATPQKTNCYAYLSAQLFAEKFMADPAQLDFHNAGISGTPSLLGVTRCEKDVLSHNPDIVFVEFAVNDGTDIINRLAYESLVRKLLNSPTQPAVILLFTTLENGYNAQAHMIKIGQHYDLGMISAHDAVQPQIKAGKMVWSDYGADSAHPNNQGHAFIAQLIGQYYDLAAAVPAADYSIPAEPFYSCELEGLKNVTKDDPAITDKGSFTYAVASCYSYVTGWKHEAAAFANKPMKLTLDATHMTIVYKQENNTSCGKAEVWVDGVLKATLSGHSENAWGNPVTQMFVLGEAGPHNIEIRMTDDCKTKVFTLLDIGYATK